MILLADGIQTVTYSDLHKVKENDSSTYSNTPFITIQYQALEK